MKEAIFDLIISHIATEVLRAEKLHPGWPEDLIHGAAIVCEEAGELIKAAQDYTWNKGPLYNAREEAVHTAATAIRFLMSLEERKERK